MNYNNVLSSKSIFVMATMLAVIMIAASSMTPLVSTRAFAQDLVVDPIVDSATEVGVNMNTDIDVVDDSSECSEANDDVSQANVQSADSEARTSGEVGENGLYVSPKVQQSTLVGYNFNVDGDIMLTDACGLPQDNLEQSNRHAVNHQAISDIVAGEGSELILPTEQDIRNIQGNLGINRDVIIPLNLD